MQKENNEARRAAVDGGKGQAKPLGARAGALAGGAEQATIGQVTFLESLHRKVKAYAEPVNVAPAEAAKALALNVQELVLDK